MLGSLIVRAFGEALHRPRAVRRLPEEIVGPSARGTEHDPLPVRRPDWMRIWPRIEGDARQRLSREVPDPDVASLEQSRTTRVPSGDSRGYR